MKIFLPFFLLLPFFVFAQNNFSGQILDEKGQPLIGATVQVEELNKLGITDSEGRFNFSDVPSGEHILTVKYLGYTTSKISISIPFSDNLAITLREEIFRLKDVYVKGTWATEKSPIAFNNISKDELAKNNLGQDLPFLLRNTPSIVVTSDAGAGVGYTGLRIRGSDASRINFTVNGIPLNDSESQGVFLVNMPDFASSTEAIQIQRGVGTSTNGAGAFGATINMQTNTYQPKAYAEIGNSYGSFNTHRHNIKLGTGLLDGKFAVDARLSKIASDGYIDRASSDLRSAYLSGGYYGDKSIVKAIAFLGREKTYQSWYGTPQSILNGEPTALNAYADRNFLSESERTNLLTSGRTYNFYEYENEVDNYGQDHYQLHWSQVLTDQFSLNAAVHYTKGAGYFEQFKAGDDFEDYSLSNLVIGGDTISSGDFIRRRWLDNDFYGYTANLKYENEKLNLVFGHAYNKYVGDHFGEIIWAEYGSQIDIRDRYYDNVGTKTDLNFFLKGEFSLTDKIGAFADMQYRGIDYQVAGIDNDLRTLNTDVSYNFFNPKLGLSIDGGNGHRAFISAAYTSREPNRSDLIDAIDQSKVSPEKLFDIEIGYAGKWKNLALDVNLFNMSYDNQLVLTGALNDVGSAIRVNVPDSYRRGVEMQLGWKVSEKFLVNFNSTFSTNKIMKFTEILYDYTVDFEIIETVYENTDISFSPNIIVGSEVIFKPIQNLEMGWNAKFISRQFLDNTGSIDKSIEPYLVNDFRIGWNPSFGNYKGVNISLNVYNFLNQAYSSNGYTFAYVVGEKITENFFYPQAGIYFLSGLTLKF